MKIFSSIREWRDFSKSLAGDLGFVPTMGALHPGHLSLVKRSLQENDYCLVSIFVNPTQFNNKEDLTSYPRPLEKDLSLLEECGVDFVLLPKFNEIYSDKYRYSVTEKDFSQKLCGAHRPGHFDGARLIRSDRQATVPG